VDGDYYRDHGKTGAQPMERIISFEAWVVLCGIAVVGVIAIPLIWIIARPEWEEGARTISGSHLAQSRVLITTAFAMACGSTLITGYDAVLNYPVIPQALLLLVAVILVISLHFARQARGQGQQVLLISGWIMTVVSVSGSLFVLVAETVG
jgi:heme/copper-type cytochrome/quinol oxidase subunit 4